LKALIIKTSSLGDIVQAFPTLSLLRQIPQLEVDWVVEEPFAELVKTHPLINQTFTIQTKKWRKNLNFQSFDELKCFCQLLRKKQYDLIIDLQGNLKSGLITAIAKGNKKFGFGFKTVAEWPNWLATNHHFNPLKGLNMRKEYLSLVSYALKQLKMDVKPTIDPINLTLNSAEQEWLDQQLQNFKNNNKLKFLICPGSRWQNKQLSFNSLENFLKLIDSQWEVQFFFLSGNEQEREEAYALQALFSSSVAFDRLSLPLLQNVISYFNLVIAMDSLPLHLAGTTKTPTYSLFGPSSALKYKPFGDQHHAFQGICPYGETFEKRCTRLRTCQTGACMKNLEHKEVFNHFSDWWRNLSQ
jgi:heptosyltransferase I